MNVEHPTSNIERPMIEYYRYDMKFSIPHPTLTFHN